MTGMDTVHDALGFIEQFKHNPDVFDPVSLSQSLRDFDPHVQHVLSAKVCRCKVVFVSTTKKAHLLRLGVADTQGKNADARKQVESGSARYAGRTVKLSPGDIKQARACIVYDAHACADAPRHSAHFHWLLQTILLSDTFNLDEMQCIRLMVLSEYQVRTSDHSMTC